MDGTCKGLPIYDGGVKRTRTAVVRVDGIVHADAESTGNQIENVQSRNVTVETEVETYRCRWMTVAPRGGVRARRSSNDRPCR